ncbi:MAG: ECF transporter S component [Firmicutes bacterium]|nr:ECF transporter S component [Bacillota bacterium]
MNTPTKRLVLAGLFLGLGLLMPFLTGQIPSVGSRLLPMHIPVLLGGFVLGGPLGLVVGFVTPLLRSMLFGMPPAFPTAFVMSFELAAYGYLAGVLFRSLPKKNSSIYVALLLAMIGGRIVWGLVNSVVLGLSGTPFTWQMFTAGALINATPGIILQIVVIPVIVLALRRARLVA